MLYRRPQQRPAIKCAQGAVRGIHGSSILSLFTNLDELAEIDVRRIMVRIHGAKFSYQGGVES
jgi:hypothetical protein